ncbi:PRD domain-containing protein [Alkalicella caledoniensis]|uniref:PRD domain-containing protein n=1 Tax=Alkalicella caledoniensis TaxID=2731377 RepID=A0A7G9W5T7_ALKCA|nr:PRD domain-containing protein [Alkalicella caledoniensis]QNO14049.1 PRD domain-containing protein [Alkalicella caledoniensis]
MLDKEYLIIKILNNNVVLALDKETNKEMILLGKGIGFAKKEQKLARIPSSKLEKSYVAYNKETKSDYLQMIDKIDPRVIGVSEELISKAEERIGHLAPHVHILLTDHIGFAIERIKMGLEIHNPFLYEIKALYDEEFSIGLMAVDLIKKAIGITICESEVGFIALHLQSARQNKKVKETLKSTRLIKELTDIIQDKLAITLSNNDFTYIRLINHLKAVLNRLEENKYIENLLLDDIKLKFQQSFLIAKLLASHIEESINVQVPENELGYITIHIERLKK